MVAHPALSCEPLTVRVLQRREHLAASFRLRYDVYGALGYLRAENRARLEIDAYDACSVAFGAFKGRALVGTLRLVTPRVLAGASRAVTRVLAAASDATLTAHASAPRAHLLPSLVSEAIWRGVRAFNRDNLPVFELSRTIVDPQYRGGGLSRKLMELGLACASHRGPAVLVGSCLAAHVDMYARYGYVPLHEQHLERYDSVGQVARAVVCRTDRLPTRTRKGVAYLLAQGGPSTWM
jgi:predicted GNAT family N-acyltransferase